MAAEFEKKAYLGQYHTGDADLFPQAPEIDTLHLLDIIEVMCGREREEHAYLDHYYQLKKKLGRPNTDHLRLQTEDDTVGVLFFGNNSLKVSAEEEGTLTREIDGFINLLNRLSQDDQQKPSKYKMRVRRDSINGKTLLTMKYKHHEDERTEEYEVEIESEDVAIPFLNSVKDQIF